MASFCSGRETASPCFVGDLRLARHALRWAGDIAWAIGPRCGAARAAEPPLATPEERHREEATSARLRAKAYWHGAGPSAEKNRRGVLELTLTDIASSKIRKILGSEPSILLCAPPEAARAKIWPQTPCLGQIWA